MKTENRQAECKEDVIIYQKINEITSVCVYSEKMRNLLCPEFFVCGGTHRSVLRVAKMLSVYMSHIIINSKAPPLQKSTEKRL